MSEQDRDYSKRMHNRFEPFALTTSAFLATIAAAFSLLANSSSILPIQPILVGVIGAFSAIIAFLLSRQIRRVQAYRFRIAVTGAPQVGKTVFSILLFDTLMNEYIPGVEFNGESRSVISVHQAIRNLSAQIWPKSTTKGNVSTYSGVIDARSRIKIDLEVGDSAGEYWLDLNDGVDRDSGYVEYVISAHAIAHVIPLDTIMEEGLEKVVDQDIEDLLLVARLRRQAKSSGRALPLLVVLSKADLVVAPKNLIDRESDLFRVVSGDDVGDLTVMRMLGDASWPLGNQLIKFGERLSRDFESVRFVFTSTVAITGNRLLGGDTGSDITRWILDEARPKNRSSLVARLFA